MNTQVETASLTPSQLSLAKKTAAYEQAALSPNTQRAYNSMWAVMDLAWFVHDFCLGELAQAFLFLCYFGLAIYGMILWFKR